MSSGLKKKKSPIFLTTAVEQNKLVVELLCSYFAKYVLLLMETQLSSL